MQLADLYREAALAANLSIGPLRRVVQRIPFLSISQRKDVLTLCRCQALPISGSTIERQMKHLQDQTPICFTRDTSPPRFMTFRDWTGFNGEVFLSPAYSGFISMMLRVAPGWREDEVEKLMTDTLSKELTSSISVYPCVHLDYRVLFGHKPMDRQRSLAYNISPNPEISYDTYVRFMRLRRELEGRLFVPDYSRKTVGEQVSQNFWEVYLLNPCFELDPATGEPGEGKVALIDLEKMWDRVGVRIGGPVEMRRAWKYNDLKPRVYFARGGDVHWASRHIQEVVNIIIDSFPEVARKDRFSGFEERFIDDSTSVFVYDYSSFTSCLEELNSFIPALADFFRGVTIRLYDIQNGIEEWDLGEYLLEYLHEANLIGKFMVEEGLSPALKDHVFWHTCGMLGVPGNIFLATLLHGLHLRFIAGIGRSKCVGDDAKAKVPETLEREEAARVLSNLGIVHPDKTAWFTPHGNIDLERYQYVKRPIYREENILMYGHLLTFPQFVDMAIDPDPYHTVTPKPDLPKTLLRSLIRFMTQVFLIGSYLDDDERYFCWCYAIFYREKVLEYTESAGNDFRFTLDRIRKTPIPGKDEFGMIEPTSWLLGHLAEGEKFEVPMSSYSSGEIIGYPGEVFVRGGSKLLGYLEDMGYVESKLEYYWTSPLELGSRLYEVYFGLYHYAKTYTVVRDIPTHAVSILNS